MPVVMVLLPLEFADVGGVGGSMAFFDGGASLH